MKNCNKLSIMDVVEIDQELWNISNKHLFMHSSLDTRCVHNIFSTRGVAFLGGRVYNSVFNRFSSITV